MLLYSGEIFSSDIAAFDAVFHLQDNLAHLFICK